MTHVYMIHQTNSSFVKIGVANDPEQRIVELQGGNPHLLKIEAITIDIDAKLAYELETSLHHQLKNYRIQYTIGYRDDNTPIIKRTEWFSLHIKMRDRLGAFLELAEQKVLLYVSCGRRWSEACTTYGLHSAKRISHQTGYKAISSAMSKKPKNTNEQLIKTAMKKWNKTAKIASRH